VDAEGRSRAQDRHPHLPGRQRQQGVRETFVDAESHAATLAHELTHWTKHEERLARDMGRIRWGDEGYAKEELVAELGSAFLCADLEITPEVREDHAYIGH
jgi:antirestriction protein ArdC